MVWLAETKLSSPLGDCFSRGRVLVLGLNERGIRPLRGFSAVWSHLAAQKSVPKTVPGQMETKAKICATPTVSF